MRYKCLDSTYPPLKDEEIAIRIKLLEIINQKDIWMLNHLSMVIINKSFPSSFKTSKNLEPFVCDTTLHLPSPKGNSHQRKMFRNYQSKRFVMNTLLYINLNMSTSSIFIRELCFESDVKSVDVPN
jgi:hypothetical protein